VTGSPSELTPLTDEIESFRHKIIVHGVGCYNW
jgi:hypothetical protein